jgi:hypothetical protein
MAGVSEWVSVECAERAAALPGNCCEEAVSEVLAKAPKEPRIAAHAV